MMPQCIVPGWRVVSRLLTTSSNSRTDRKIASYTACMERESTDAIVGIGLVCVVPGKACEVLSADNGA